MFRIRAVQMEAFREQKRRELARWLAAHLRRSRVPAVESLAEGALFEETLAGIRRAEAYGLVESDAAARFVSTMFLRGRCFDAHPAIRALLTDPAVPAALRMDMVFATISEAQWREARALGPGGGDGP
ncbi:MAG TPA: hypothetical protein VJ276_13860 [Thermoanaerobaculia bacterium]|nr:hypothetical protein [Thermoanaerobaculia bacterium]